MIRRSKLPGVVLGLALASVAGVALAAAPSHAKLRAQVQAADAKVAAAHDKNASLQAQVTQLEQQTEAQQKQLQQRDAEIAALQAKLKAAGVPVSTATTGN